MVAIRNAYRPGPAPEPWAPRLAEVVELTRGQRLLKRIQAFMRENPQVAAKTFGRLACNNCHLVERLEDGLNPEDVTIQRVEAFIARYQA